MYRHGEPGKDKTAVVMSGELETIYVCHFKSERGTSWGVNILSSAAPFAERLIPVSLARDGAAVIEWCETGKLDPVAGSSLTLKLLSERDREFLWLWQATIGTVRCDIFRNGVLYWSGVLDTELYEEPYSWARDYEVTVTFSDFAILDRLKWEGEGLWSVKGILDHCIAEIGVHVLGLVQQHGLYSPNHLEVVTDLSDLWIESGNFYDEDGEAMTLREVLEAVLQPLSLRLTQKGGKLWLQDLHTLATEVGTEQVKWLSDDGMLGVDKVYNNVKVTFSPYGESKLIDGSVDHDEVLKDHVNGGTLIKTDMDFSAAADGFRIYYGDQDGLGLTLLNCAKWYRIDSVWSGSDEAGVLWGYRGGPDDLSADDWHPAGVSIPHAINDMGQCVSVPIVRSNRMWLGRSNSIYHRLKVTLSVLADVRYNPFESESADNEEGNWSQLQNWVNFAYIPVMLRLHGVDGSVWHYENDGARIGSSFGDAEGRCGWVAGAGSWGDMWLCYYDPENRKSASGLGGWKKNRPILGYYRGKLPKRFTAPGEGEYIKMPPVAGWLELEIGRGLYQHDYNREEKDIYSRLRWLLYKSPTVEVVKADGSGTEQNDVEDSAWLLRDAAEGLELDTTVGTLGSQSHLPSCKGLLLDANGEAVGKLTRAGVYDRVERLLIGTVYSQYGSRHQTLGGSVELLHTMCALTDASSAGKYMVLSEVQTLVEDKSEVLLCEVSEDNYEGVDWESD